MFAGDQVQPCLFGGEDWKTHHCKWRVDIQEFHVSVFPVGGRLAETLVQLVAALLTTPSSLLDPERVQLHHSAMSPILPVLW